MVRRLLLVFLCALVMSPAWADILIGKVVGVADGDTVTVLDDSRTQHKIRLSGIDTPERNQPSGRRAKEKLAGLVFGKTVVVEIDKVDRYGRNIGKVVIDGRDANLAMITAGLAWHYKKYQTEQSASDRRLYSRAEDDARAGQLGLWREPEPIAPWDWRKGGR